MVLEGVGAAGVLDEVLEALDDDEPSPFDEPAAAGSFFTGPLSLSPPSVDEELDVELDDFRLSVL